MLFDNGENNPATLMRSQSHAKLGIDTHPIFCRIYCRSAAWRWQTWDAWDSSEAHIWWLSWQKLQNMSNKDGPHHHQDKKTCQEPPIKTGISQEWNFEEEHFTRADRFDEHADQCMKLHEHEEPKKPCWWMFSFWLYGVKGEFSQDQNQFLAQ